MAGRQLVLASSVAAALAWFGSGTTPIAQSPAAQKPIGLKTPWGDPDLQGIWSPGYILTPLQRPERFAGKEFLTDEEVSELEQQAAASPGRNERLDDAFEDLAGAYNDVFSGRGTKVVRTKRTSLIVDPADGRIPFKELRPAAPRAGRGPSRRTTSYQVDTDESELIARTGGFDGPEDRRNDRCLGITLPFVGGSSGTFSRLVQAPGSIALFYEDGHRGGIYRTIGLGDRPHLPSSVRQWAGHSVGKWEGETLVVDTTNFTNKTNFNGSRDGLHLVERYTRTAPDVLMYRVTIDDPSVFSRLWTVEIPLLRADDKANHIYEAACHEGNQSMVGILAGARALERENSGSRRR